jgi:hypothetical protein
MLLCLRGALRATHRSLRGRFQLAGGLGQPANALPVCQRACCHAPVIVPFYLCVTGGSRGGGGKGSNLPIDELPDEGNSPSHTSLCDTVLPPTCCVHAGVGEKGRGGREAADALLTPYPPCRRPFSSPQVLLLTSQSPAVFSSPSFASGA